MPVLAIAYTSLTAPGRSDPGPGVCPSCGSPNIVPVEWHGPTGVTSPDGGEEYRMQYGIQCRDCGATEEI
jgi:hypothetical protein